MKHETHLSCQSEYRSALVHSSRMSLAWIICMAISVDRKNGRGSNIKEKFKVRR